jgi:purine-binding chemotaxis protein CheW
MSLREIRGWSQVAPLPDTPDYVLGVVNLRGTVLPIIDLAKRLNLEKSEAQDRSIIMITQVEGKMVGLLADSVSDIISVNSSEIQDAPGKKTNNQNLFLRGLIAREDQMIGLVSLPHIVSETALLAA